MTGGRHLTYIRAIQQDGGHQRSISGCRRPDDLKALLPVMVLLLVLVSTGIAPASMYVCRDKRGGVSYTNVPASGSCTALGSRKSARRPAAVFRGGNSSRFDKEIRRIGRRYSVDPSLIKAIIHTESAFDHRAVSTQGAQGLMQLMPATARELRVSNPFNPRENIEGGTRYFRKLMDSFNGDLILSLAAYNAGPGMVMRAGGVPKIPETRRYVNKVLKRYKKYKAVW